MKNLINSLKFSLGNNTPKPVQNWSSDWTKEEDEKLLIGVFKYGYGSWTQIRDDPFLGITDKIFLNEVHNPVAKQSASSSDTTPTPSKKGKGITGSSKKVPGAIHLGRRVDYLLSFLREGLNTKSPSADIGSKKLPTGPSKKRQRKPANHSKSMTPEVTSSLINNTRLSPNGPTPPLKSKVSRDNGTRQSSNPSSGSAHEKEYDSMDEEDCRHTMSAIRTSLKRLRRGGKGLDRKEWAKILKTELTTIGNHIESQKGSSRKASPEKYRKHLWSYSANFWPADVKSTKLMAMYDKITESQKK